MFDNLLGQLRLAVRQFGTTNSDSGFQFADSVLYFSNPNAINSITTDITLRSFSNTSCSTNPTAVSRTMTSVGGVYFNTGSGQSADDVNDMVFFLVDTNSPKTISVINWTYLKFGWFISLRLANMPQVAHDTSRPRFTSFLFQQ